ncbi:uncharacterized protein LY79DRAFT_572310 [Colletotrichum navitas]|uniref:Uncharacterized protein n=1 Tax=Colletotrichum navitas TaxID=681940 RepID=A0AAD8UW42_9PEZI|nr:uncharacterized protein LY79DRAFT_572310 [Colletotrichum navitas]KAK1566327.1 hypothetical protein LY79DRAFT_572310 [Colletotrichum navitas]
MRLRYIAFSLLMTSGSVLAVPRPRGEALPIILIPRVSKSVPKRTQSSNEYMASTGRTCGNTIEKGVCYNGRCGIFVAPTGFEAIPETESQCL